VRGPLYSAQSLSLGVYPVEYAITSGAASLGEHAMCLEPGRGSASLPGWTSGLLPTKSPWGCADVVLSGGTGIHAIGSAW
jgi:hypothetical protein